MRVLCEIAAIIAGGIWTYFLFIRGRTLKARLEPSVKAIISARNGRLYLIADAELKNVGIPKVDLDTPGSGVAVYPGRPKGTNVEPACSVEWEERGVFDIFKNHQWVEPDETIRDVLMVELPENRAPFYKVELMAVNRHKKAQNWCVAAIAEEQDPE